MNIVTDVNKQVTDPVLLSHLARQGINSLGVELFQDYASRSLGKEHSPYAKFYRDLNSDKRFMVVSNLPMVDADGVKIEVGWQIAGINYFSEKHNLFRAKVQDTEVEITVRNDQSDGRKAGGRLTFKPQLFVGDMEQFCGNPTLLSVDPINSNYFENTLEWDYGVAKRRLRIIEGQLLGSWVFDNVPSGEVKIKYNQLGSYRLRLGVFKVNEDEEIIPLLAFDNPVDGFPFIVSDSSTFYPDQVNTMAGRARYNAGNVAWATAYGHAGSDADVSAIQGYILNGTADNNYTYIARGPCPFDTSSLDDNANITDGTVSFYGAGKTDTNNTAPSLVLTSSNQTDVNNVVAGDYALARWGTVEFAARITYANFTVGAYNVFNLNAAGLANISKTSFSRFGIRLSYDFDNSQPAWNGESLNQGLTAYVSGAGQQPKLVVTYTSGSKSAHMAAKMMAGKMI